MLCDHGFQAFDIIGKTGESIPLIFFITDGSVEDEKDICKIMKERLVDGGINCPRICTFGIGEIFFITDSILNLSRFTYIVPFSYAFKILRFILQSLFFANACTYG